MLNKPIKIESKKKDKIEKELKANNKLLSALFIELLG